MEGKLRLSTTYHGHEYMFGGSTNVQDRVIDYYDYSTDKPRPL